MGTPGSNTTAHDRAAICAIGDELTLGQNTDTNSAWIASRLTSIGVITIEHTTVPDEARVIASTIQRLATIAPLVVITGGLGPTPDDCTRQALAQALNEDLIEDAEAIEWLEAFSTRLSRPLPTSNRVQALRPASASLIHNPHGTAPGLHAKLHSSDIYCLPGPPREMQPMFDAAITPTLGAGNTKLITRFINTFGIGESAVAERLHALLARDASPTVGLTSDGVDVRFRIRANDDRQIESTTKQITDAMGAYIFSEGETPLCETVVDMLMQRGQCLATVESCTGGLLGSMLTAIPGSSAVYPGGWVTYSNEMKSACVSVPTEMLDEFGAVSEPVARAMAQGALSQTESDHALAITGIAGPGGGSEGKPVGTVFIAHASKTDGVAIRQFRFTGDRDLVRKRSAQAALAMLRFHLIGENIKPLLWQMK